MTDIEYWECESSILIKWKQKKINLKQKHIQIFLICSKSIHSACDRTEIMVPSFSIEEKIIVAGWTTVGNSKIKHLKRGIWYY